MLLAGIGASAQEGATQGGGAGDGLSAAVREVVKPIRSIDPDDTDFADLAVIGEAIEEARVVVLGEATVGDGASHLMKSRLVKYLHGELGFTVLVYEASLGDCHLMNIALERGDDPRDVAAVGLTEYWAQSGHASEAIRYAWASFFDPDPLRVAGFGWRSASAAPNRGWARELIDFVRELDPEPWDRELRARFLTLPQRATEAVNNGDDIGMIDAWQDWAELQERFTGLREPLIAQHGEAAYGFWARAVEDRLAQFEEALDPRPPLLDVDLKSRNADAGKMGENLVWLATEAFPDEKLIVWTRTELVLGDPGSIETRPEPGITQGYEPPVLAWREALGGELIVLGITGGSGVSGEVGVPSQPMPDLGDESVEALLDKTGLPFAFVDFEGVADGHPLAEKRVSDIAGLSRTMRGMGFINENEVRATADWTRQLDGLIYLRRMFPATGNGSIPTGAILRTGEAE